MSVSKWNLEWLRFYLISIFKIDLIIPKNFVGFVKNPSKALMSAGESAFSDNTSYLVQKFDHNDFRKAAEFYKLLDQNKIDKERSCYLRYCDPVSNGSSTYSISYGHFDSGLTFTTIYGDNWKMELAIPLKREIPSLAGFHNNNNTPSVDQLNAWFHTCVKQHSDHDFNEILFRIVKKHCSDFELRRVLYLALLADLVFQGKIDGTAATSKFLEEAFINAAK